MIVKNFIKVTVISSGLSSIVPVANKPHYEQANDLEKKAKKSAIYKIEEATEAEIVKYYPELGKDEKAKTIPIAESDKKLAEKDKKLAEKDEEIEALKEKVAAQSGKK